MSRDEQQQLKIKYYNEAIRYMDNANDVLKHAGKEGRFYKDPKYVKMACGTAYNGVLIALEAYLLLKGVEKSKKRKSIEYYIEHISKLDKKFLSWVNNVYDTLHLSGYYDGNLNVHIIQEGFSVAYEIIGKIKPAQAA